MSKFADELEELIEQILEDEDATKDEVIAELESKLAAMKEEHGEK